MANESCQNILANKDLSHDPRRLRRRLALTCLSLAWLLGLSAEALRAQTYLQGAGTPAFTMALPVEDGFINASNGNLHLTIPVETLPQRGGRPLQIAFEYDSAMWAWVYSWYPGAVPGYQNGPWRILTSGDHGFVNYTDGQGKICNLDGNPEYDLYTFTGWTSAEGTTRPFWMQTKQNWPTQCIPNPGPGTRTASGYANDASGFYLSVTNYTNATVYAPDGTAAYSSTSNAPEDTNGNYFSGSADTAGRTPVATTINGNQIYYDIPDSRGSTRRYTVTTATINLKTNFGQPGITECTTCGVTVFQSIKLPDNTLYSFKYDCDSSVDSTDCNSPSGRSAYYGLLTSMTLPTGGQISYAYTVFTDAQSNHYNWITGKTTPDGTWSYTPSVVTSCSANQVDCQQKLTVQKPNGDNTAYTSALNGGAWTNSIQFYTGGVSSSNLLSTVTQCWNIVTVSNGNCSYTVSSGSPASNVTKSATTTVMPVPGGTSLSKTNEYAYDNYGNTTQVSEWNYYASMPANADRTTCITYLGGTNYQNAHILNRPSSMTVVDNWSSTPCTSPPAAHTVAQTNYCYDYAGGCGGSAFASATGMANHDDTNYGTSNAVRGDVTQVQRLISGTTNFLTTSMTYDMTGQVKTSTDSNSNVTTLDYTDNFYDDPGDGSTPTIHNVSKPTNAFLKKTTFPTVNSVSLTKTFGYYWGTGQIASTTDANGNINYAHFYEPFNRKLSPV